MVAKVIKNQIENIQYKEKKIFWVLFLVFAILIISYGFLVNSIILKGISKQNMQKNMSTLGSEVNSLEFKYLNIKNNITLDFALSKGFVSVNSDKFASIDKSSKNLSLSINEN